MKIKIEHIKICETKLKKCWEKNLQHLNAYIGKERRVKSTIKALTLRTKKITSNINSKQAEERR